MHPGYMLYWKNRHRRDGCGPAYATSHCGPSARETAAEWTWTASARGGDAVFGSAGFGIRRPVRFLGMRLDLDDKQLSQLARIVERIRIERDQAAVDLRRAAGEIADTLEEGDFDEAAVEAAGQQRVDAAKRVQEVVSSALRELHELLDEEQRLELASLIRTGAVRL